MVLPNTLHFLRATDDLWEPWALESDRLVPEPTTWNGQGKMARLLTLPRGLDTRFSLTYLQSL